MFSLIFVINLPLLLTIIRLIVAPFFLPFFFIFFLPLQDIWVNFGLMLFFVFLSLTDFFDGYLARKYNQVTVAGMVLDPIADKFLLSSALISLLVVHKIFFFWVIIFLLREFFVTGLRLIIKEFGHNLPVSRTAKIKTLLQIIFISWVILNPFHEVGVYGAPWWNSIEYILLTLALFFSLFSAFFYFQNSISIFRMGKK